MNKLLPLLAIIAISFCACKKDKRNPPTNPPGSSWTNRIPALHAHNEKKITVKQGVAGTITGKSGNCMPAIDPNVCKEFPLQTTIRIYPYTLSQQTTRDQEGYFTVIPGQPVAALTTDAEGFYQVTLPAGKYSVFIEENGRLWAGTSDSGGGIQPVTINTGVTIGNFTADHAVY